MNEIVRLKKKNYTYLVKAKNYNNHLTNNFDEMSEKRLTSSTYKTERKFV